MKTIGIVGGLGPESTIDYYRLFIAAGHTELIINSVAVKHVVSMMLNGDPTGVANYLTDAVGTLAKAGADVAIIAANSPHIVFDDVQSRSHIPMVSIVEAVADYVLAAGMTRVGLLGTRFTMTGQFYPDVFAKRGLSLVVPTPADLDWVHDKYLGEFLNNQFLPETRDGVLAVIDRMKYNSGITAVVLGGTELPILLRADTHNGVALLDTTRIHVDAVLRFASQNSDVDGRT